MKVRRSGALLVLTGMVCVGVSAVPLLPASAGDEAGSGLGSFSLAANAPTVQFREDDGSNCSGKPASIGACEGVINESVATLRNGPVGYALASVGWPGMLAGNLGSLLIVANDQVPEEAKALNSPVRAENTTGGTDETVRNESLPGASMIATARPDLVEATSAIGAAQVTPLGSVGRLESLGKVRLTGVRTAQAVAHSEVNNLDIGGVVKVKSIVSDATAVTDGVRATASGKTTITGATVAGVPVTIDERGVTVQTHNVPFPAAAISAVQEGLRQAGIILALSGPVGKPDGAGVVYNSGALVIFWQQQPRQSMSLQIGGAQVSVDASPGYDVDGPVDPVVQPPVTSPEVPGEVGSPPYTSGPPFLEGGVTGSAPTTAPPSVVVVPVASRMALPTGLSPWYGVLAALGSLLVMAGLRRLPAHVLAIPATDCPLGDRA